MPIFDPREGKSPMLPTIILANIFPLVGIIYYDVSFFALFYLYWWETVMISIFRWLKMAWAEKPSEPDPNFKVNGKTLSHETVNNRRKMRIQYFFLRSGMMLFYLLFIVVFVGVISTMQEDPAAFARAITFNDKWVFWSFIAFTLLHFAEYISWVRSGTYKETTLVELATPFDARILVIHVVIVLGTFLSMYTSETLFPEHPKAASIGYASLFVLLKVIVEVYTYQNNHSRQETLTKLEGALRNKK